MSLYNQDAVFRMLIEWRFPGARHGHRVEDMLAKVYAISIKK